MFVRHDGYRFLEFEANARYHRLMRGYRVEPLRPREFELLLLLAELAGQFVSADQIIQRVWSGAPIDANTVATYIRRLRRKLGETAIETSYKSGYKLACKVERLNTPEEMRARHLIAIFDEAEDLRRSMPDADWEPKFVPLIDDLRDAINWALEDPARQHIATALVSVSGRVWESANALQEGQRYIDRALTLINTYTLPYTKARVLYYAGIFCRETDRTRALAYFQQSAEIFRKLDDYQGLGTLLGVIGDAYVFLGQNEKASESLKKAKKLLEFSVNPRALMNINSSLGTLSATTGLPSEAMAHFDEARKLAQLLDDELREYLIVLNIAELEAVNGALDRAIQWAHEAERGLALAPKRYALRVPVNLALYYAALGNLQQARRFATKAIIPLAEQGGHWLRLCLLVWCQILGSGGRAAEAACLLGFVEHQFRKTGVVLGTVAQQIHARLIVLLGESLTCESVEVWRKEGSTWTELQAVKHVTRHFTTADSL